MSLDFLIDCLLCSCLSLGGSWGCLHLNICRSYVRLTGWWLRTHSRMASIAHKRNTSFLRSKDAGRVPFGPIRPPAPCESRLLPLKSWWKIIFFRLGLFRFSSDSNFAYQGSSWLPVVSGYPTIYLILFCFFLRSSTRHPVTFGRSI